MTRGQLRQHVRDLLGEPGPRGFWDDTELDRYIQIEADRHAQEALSVEASVVTSSVPDVMDYQLPEDFGEIKDVRFIDNITTGPEPLDYVARSEILREVGEINTLGEPCVFYRWEDCIGLYPVPNKPAVLEHKFSSERPEHYTPVAYTDDLNAQQYFNDTLRLHLEDDPDDPFYRVFISHVSVYLRRAGLNLPGELEMIMRDPLEGDGVFYDHISQPIPASLVKPIGDWYHFDFSHNPIRINTDAAKEFTMSISTDSPYLAADFDTYADRVEIAIDDPDDEVAYFLLHQVKNDIEIDYYRNITDELKSDDDEIQIPERYNRTLVKQVCGRALKKNRLSLQAALVYDREAQAEISYARSQAMVKTLGSILRVERFNRRRRRPYMTYLGNGRFRGRLY